MHHLASEDVRNMYQKLLTEKLNAIDGHDVTSGGCWSALKSSMLSVAEVGYGGRAQPDWSSEFLTPLIEDDSRIMTLH